MRTLFKKNKKRWALGLVVLVVSVAIGASYILLKPQTGLTMTLKADGWHPSVLTIEPGQSVTFINKTKSPFWPASNTHPQHNLYAAFDSGKALAPGSSWTFTFTELGRWGLHDHLRPYYTGYINVGQAAVTYDCETDIATIDIAQKRECWNTKLLDELKSRGAMAAFNMFARFYTSDTDFTRIGCHVIAHNLGDAAYGEYVLKGKKIESLEFPAESAYCGYGYYHGILEHMIREDPDPTKAANFCEWVITNHEKILPSIRLNCYHALGHGFTPEPTDVEMWGDAPRMTAPAIQACSTLPAEDIRQECLQGTFNVVGDWMWTNQFGLRFPKEDPLSLCRSYENKEVSKACYYELSMRLTPLVDSLPELYTKYVAAIEEDDIATMIMNSAAASALGSNIKDTNFIPFLKECRAVPERAREGCLKGLSAAFLAHGEPGKEYVKAIAYCSDPEQTVSEKQTCHWNMVRTFKKIYSPEKVAELCTQLAPEYRSLCVYEGT